MSQWLRQWTLTLHGQKLQFSLGSVHRSTDMYVCATMPDKRYVDKIKQQHQYLHFHIDGRMILQKF